MLRNAIREANQDTLGRLGRDWTLINNEQLSAVDLYLLLGMMKSIICFWDRLHVDIANEVVVLIRSDEQNDIDKALHWMPLTNLYTRKQAHLFYQVLDTEGPFEEVMHEILQLFHEGFEYAVETRWTYDKCVEFHHSFPFEELRKKEAVTNFQPVLLGCPAFADFEFKFPKNEW